MSASTPLRTQKLCLWPWEGFPWRRAGAQHLAGVLVVGVGTWGQDCSLSSSPTGDACPQVRSEGCVRPGPLPDGAGGVRGQSTASGPGGSSSKWLPGWRETRAFRPGSRGQLHQSSLGTRVRAQLSWLGPENTPQPGRGSLFCASFSPACSQTAHTSSAPIPHTHIPLGQGAPLLPPAPQRPPPHLGPGLSVTFTVLLAAQMLRGRHP